MQTAHARLAARGIWALNEKRMLQWAGMQDLTPTFAALGSTPADLHRAVDAVSAVFAEVCAEVGYG
jgi:hypothetical protein